jgi:hypothetical protein
VSADHRDTMVELARQLDWKRGIEIGLGGGQLFARLLAVGVRMIGVDLGLRAERRAKVEAICRTDPRVENVHWMASADAAPLVPDGWADFLFIDAGHSYGAVKADIAAWEAKVKPGGWIGGHDYHPMFPGVIRAVSERYCGRITLLPGNIWSRV